jgi:hypothetical protein
MATKVDKIVRATKIAEKFKEKIHEHRLADHVHEAFPKLEKELDPSSQSGCMSRTAVMCLKYMTLASSTRTKPCTTRQCVPT